MPEMYVATRKLAGNGDEKKTDSGGKKKGKKRKNLTTPHQIQRNKNERKMTGKKRERERSRKIQKTLSTNANQVEEEKMTYTEDVGKESSCTDNAAGARSLAKYLTVNTKQEERIQERRQE
jgi:hypothetical protein